MAKVLVQESSLEDIGDALREKLQTGATFAPSEMGNRIRSINVIEVDPTLSHSGQAADAAVTGSRIEALETQVVTDATLSVSGKSADAAVTGAAITSTRNDLSKAAMDAASSCDMLELKSYRQWSDNSYIRTNVAEGAAVDWLAPQESNNFMYATMLCYPGWIVKIKEATGGNAGRLWAFIDDQSNLISSAAANAHAEELELVIPQNAARCIINVDKRQPVKAIYMVEQMFNKKVANAVRFATKAFHVNVTLQPGEDFEINSYTMDTIPGYKARMVQLIYENTANFVPLYLSVGTSGTLSGFLRNISNEAKTLTRFDLKALYTYSEAD